jgi:ABC-2 type transport system permease protein
MNSRSLTKYGSIFKTQMLNQMTYAGDLAARSLTIVLFMWIFFQLWRVTYSSSGTGSQSIAGLTLRDTLWYLMLAETIMLSRTTTWRDISDAVKDGSIAYLLNKPFNFLLYQASVSLGSSLWQMLFNALAGGAVVWLLVGPPPSPAGWPLVAAVVLLAWAIDFCLSALIGLAAFVTEDVSAFNWIYTKFQLVLGGVLIPLDFYPEWLQQITRYLPYAYTIYGPARLFVDPALERFTGLVLGQALWLAGMGLLLALVYRRCVSWLNINGG